MMLHEEGQVVCEEAIEVKARSLSEGEHNHQQKTRRRSRSQAQGEIEITIGAIWAWRGCKPMVKREPPSAENERGEKVIERPDRAAEDGVVRLHCTVVTRRAALQPSWRTMNGGRPSRSTAAAPSGIEGEQFSSTTSTS